MAGEEKVRRYRAFIAYSHHDRRWANWLHRRLEFYRVPRRLIGRKTAAGTIARRLNPVFRDREELATAGDLSEKITQALAGSDALIVICSPHAACSKWVNEEILRFKRGGRGTRIFCLVVDGEPTAAENGSDDRHECFPPALRHRGGDDGGAEDDLIEPLAADVRTGGDGRGLALLKIIAGLLDVDLDELRRRELQRRNRRWAAVAASALVVMTATSLLALEATHQRNVAEHRRAQAESLVAFMLGNLRTELQPIGRLDLLDMIGKRALAYYSSQDPDTMDADSLERRARALRLIGDVDSTRGHLDSALSVFHQAAATTARLLSLEPDNPQRIYDHAQSVYWVGYIAWERGDFGQAETEFGRYQALARQLVQIDPGKAGWQAELGYSYSSLGTVLLSEDRVKEAVTNFRRAVNISTSLAERFPDDTGRQVDMAQTRDWLADAQERLGHFEAAYRLRMTELGIYKKLLAKNPDNSNVRRSLVTCNQALAHLAIGRGDLDSALARIRASVSLADGLVAQDVSNAFWQELDAASYVRLGIVQFERNKLADASTAAARAMRIARDLVKQDPTVLAWQIGLLARARLLRASIAAREGRHSEALSISGKVAEKLSGLPAKKKDSAVVRSLLIQARMLQGDQLQALGRKGSDDAWNAALGIAHTNDGSPTPATRTLIAGAYLRIGNTREAERIAGQLDSTGYRSPEFVALQQRIHEKHMNQARSYSPHHVFQPNP